MIHDPFCIYVWSSKCFLENDTRASLEQHVSVHFACVRVHIGDLDLSSGMTVCQTLPQPWGALSHLSRRWHAL